MKSQVVYNKMLLRVNCVSWMLPLRMLWHSFPVRSHCVPKIGINCMSTLQNAILIKAPWQTNWAFPLKAAVPFGWGKGKRLVFSTDHVLKGIKPLLLLDHYIHWGLVWPHTYFLPCRNVILLCKPTARAFTNNFYQLLGPVVGLCVWRPFPTLTHPLND